MGYFEAGWSITLIISSIKPNHHGQVRLAKIVNIIGKWFKKNYKKAEPFYRVNKIDLKHKNGQTF
jgi:hypothetical protein